MIYKINTILRKLKHLAWAILIVLAMATPAPAQNFSIETYLPPPVGVYDQIRLEPTPTPASDVCKSGSFYYDSILTDLQFCQDDDSGNMTGTWSFFAPIWITKGDNTFIKDIDSYAHPEKIYWLIGATSRNQAHKGDEVLTLRADNPLDSDGSILAVGTHGEGTPLPTRATLSSTANGRLIWYPRKSAFRAGEVSNDAWDDTEIGDYSTAFNQNTRAKGIASFAAGTSSNAYGDYSTAMGDHSTANGDYSAAIGVSTTTDENATASFALGSYSRVSGANSFALGNSIRVDGNNSIGIGLDGTSTTLTKNNVMAIMGGPVAISRGSGEIFPTNVTDPDPLKDLHVYNHSGDANIFVGQTSDDMIPILEMNTPNYSINGGRWEIRTGGEKVLQPEIDGGIDYFYDYGDSVSIAYVDNADRKEVLGLNKITGVGFGTVPRFSIPGLTIKGSDGTLRLESDNPSLEFVSLPVFFETDPPDFNFKYNAGNLELGSRTATTGAYTPKFYFSYEGNLGIGEPSTESDILLAKDGTLNFTAGTGVMAFKTDTDYFNLLFHDTGHYFEINYDTNYTDPPSKRILYINPSGQIGIQTTIPTVGKALTINGTLAASGTIIGGSSRTLKKDIEPLSLQESRKAFSRLHPMQFNYIQDQNKDTHMGFIAEDLPKLLSTADKRSVSPMDVIAVLTKIMQEQQKVLDEQQKDLETLKSKLKEM